MWLSSSTVGRKVVMSISGLFLILFLTFHMSMNLVALFSAEGYNAVCGFLGANWYALVGTLVLAFGMFVHIIYAFWLTIQNRRARGNVRYAVVDKPKGVEWASQNMLVLGIIVIGVACFHLYHFWYNMQLQEILGKETADVAACVIGSANDLSGVSVHDGYSFIVATFSNPVVVVLYLIWFVAIWLVQSLENNSKHLYNIALPWLCSSCCCILHQVFIINQFNYVKEEYIYVNYIRF